MGWRPYLLGSACLLMFCAGFAREAHARTTTENHASPKQDSKQLSIQVNDDKMTLAITRVPQVYLYGVIDTDSPQRVAALMQSRKIPNGSDIYLNASGGDVHAGMALGRLFRSGAMSTHLGTPRQHQHAPVQAKTAICTGACTYAYLGGLYRWTPSGFDRIGLQSADPKPDSATQTPDDITSYLHDMGIKPESLAPATSTSRDDAMWLSADQMLSTGVANNGNQPLTATFQSSPGAPSLVISQLFRNGEHRIVLQCNPGVVNVTAYDVVGTEHARQIVAHGFRSYMEVNQQESASQERDGVSVADQAVVISRLYPSTQLGKLLYGYTLGAWVSERNAAFRYGFAFVLNPVRGTLGDFYQSCWRFAPWPTTQGG
ncbi:hypothetical protein [Dyella psychrodurans]|uniref:hypothetical protein n=1 Tax=Dyella psychrodurans TaxID=1927960 RepID=UPI001F309C6B|nr:hypothetical protein [Dyella psychrodurans]